MFTEEYCALIPAIGCLLLTVLAFNSSLKKEYEAVCRGWWLIFGIVMIMLTTYLFNYGAKEIQRYSRNDYIYYNENHIY